MDEFIDQLLREDRVTDIQLPRLQVNTEQIQFSYINSLLTLTRFRGKVNIINSNNYVRID